MYHDKEKSIRCPRCGKEKTLIRWIMGYSEGEPIWGNYAWVCTNENCPLHSNLEKVENWKIINK